MAKNPNNEAGAGSSGAKSEEKPKAEVAVIAEALPTVEFQRRMAAVVIGSRGFGGADPMAKVRLEEAISRAMGGIEHARAAKEILESLRSETVTGTQTNGAEAVLGDDLPEFDALIDSLLKGYAELRGEI